MNAPPTLIAKIAHGQRSAPGGEHVAELDAQHGARRSSAEDRSQLADVHRPAQWSSSLMTATIWWRPAVVSFVLTHGRYPP